MKDFGRVLLIAARHHLAMIMIVITAGIIASLWGANIATLGPLIKVVFEGHTLSQYAEIEMAATTEKIDDLDAKIADTRQQLAATETEDDVKQLTRSLQNDIGVRDAYAKTIDWLNKIRPYVDRYAPNDPYSTLIWLIGLLMIGTCIKLAALMSNLLLVQYVTEQTSMKLRAIFFRKSLHLDLDQFGEHGSASLTSRLTNDISVAAGGIGVILGRLLREPLKLIVCLAGAAWVCWRLLLVVMIITPLVALVIHYMSRAIRRASRRTMEEMSQLYGVLNDSFAGIRIIRAFNTQAKERAKFQHRIRSYFRKSLKVGFYNSLARSVTELIGMAVITVAVLAGGYLAINQQTHLFGIRMSMLPLDRTEIILFFGFLIGATDPAKKLADVWSSLQSGIAASTRVFDIIDQPTRVHDVADPKSAPRPHHTLTFEKIRYQYPSGPMVLRGLDLTVRHGETVAIVGPNGCGKSTLISLLCRFDDPQSGRVMLNDVPITEMRCRDVRRRLALVTQRTILFDDTIENNIRYGTPSATKDDVIRAAKLAFADEFIREKTPFSYQTRLGVGSNASRLSGGQMQRIALARAFLRDPDILILDEATSQIDTESEQLIHKALEQFLNGRTGVMITHRPSTLALADRVIVMESGKISGDGEHQELIRSNRFYQSLCGGEIERAA
ncbi:ABC transporter ATP-binding protein [Crateriforma conspicua]|uniref:ABC transporter ATP-binding protein n=1 Tax=Crateriforma conspicua TaxID=2527996 RepID=UPI0011877CD1|nr:ABC transporter ATP-binding protein [Crateriforma conspicua]QDV60947.1 Lipid A export ATP-binding/permease protein MsbA [Crateriforma conspicua]